MAKRLIIFTYTFVAGVGTSMFFLPGPEICLPLYIAAGMAGVAGWALAFMAEKGRFEKEFVVVALLMASAFSLGYARFATEAYIPPFDEKAESNHIKSFIAKFPDHDRKERTRLVGRIVSEPEYRPAAGKPGIVALIVHPELAAPEADAGVTYPIDGGNIQIFLRPSGPFRQDEAEFEKIFERLAIPDGYGYTIECDVQLQDFRPSDNPGLFNAEDFYNDQAVFATGSVNFWDRMAPPIVIKEESEGNPIVELALALKKQMLGIIKQTVPFPESAFLAGVTLGARRGLDGVRCVFEEAPPVVEGADASEEPDFRKLVLDEFRWSGTSHVLAVSGLHVTIIAGALWGLFVSLRIPKKVYAPFVVLGLAIFCLITGAAPSSTRAVIMNSLVILTYVYLGSSFRASLLLAIGVSGFVILMNNPRWLIQPSFALSFMAVLSLGLLTPPFEAIMKNIPGMQKLPVWTQQFIYAQGSIQFGMMGPLSAYYFCRMSMAGPLANFLAIPMIGIIVQLGIFACALGMIPGVGIWLALVLNAANYICIWLFLWTAHISTVITPFPMVQTMTPRMIVAYYMLLALFVWSKPILRQAKILYYDLVMRIGGTRRRFQAIAFFGGLFLYIGVLSIGGFWPRHPSGNLHVNFLSVRYGQSIHIETPNGAHILIDAGPNDYKGGWNTGERTISQYLLKDRIGALDAVVMTNTSPEDMGGIAAILKIFPTKRFYSVLPVWNWNLDNPEEFKKQAAKALQNSVEQGVVQSEHNADFEDMLYHLSEVAMASQNPWNFFRILEVLLISPISLGTSFGPPEKFEIEGGMVLWSEDAPGGKFRIVALHPNPEFPLKPVNNNSVVLRVDYGATAFLLTSDLTADGVRELLRIPPELLKADVIVVPAHGSPKANIPYLYEVVKPELALLSYGYNRSLRPPAGPGRGRNRETYRDSFLDHRRLFQRDVEDGANQTAVALEAAGITVARTDLNGAVLCRSDGKTVSYVSMIGGVKSEDQGSHEDVERFREF